MTTEKMKNASGNSVQIQKLCKVSLDVVLFFSEFESSEPHFLR